jgi:hypothetical protein
MLRSDCSVLQYDTASLHGQNSFDPGGGRGGRGEGVVGGEGIVGRDGVVGREGVVGGEGIRRDELV